MPTWRTLPSRKSKRTAPSKRPTPRPNNRLAVESLEQRWMLSNYTVLNTNDAGAGSLRQAILDANANPGADAIDFNMAASDANHIYYQDDGVAGKVTEANVTVTSATNDSTIADIDPDHPHSFFRIKPTSVLPTSTGPLIINGYTQAGASVNTLPNGDNAVLRIDLDGSLAGSPFINALVFAGGNSTVRGLAIHSFTGNAISFPDKDGYVVEGNFLGSSVAGLSSIGGSSVAGPGSLSNRIGVLINDASGTALVGNRIGTDADGVNDPGERNLISGNSWGVLIQNSPHVIVPQFYNVVAGNFIGTDRTGTVTDPDGIAGSGDELGNFFGIQIATQASYLIGGTTAAARNIISGNTGYGINLSGTTAPGIAKLVQGNFIGTDVTGTLPLGNDTGLIAGDGTLIGGTAPGARNVISGNLRGGVGIGGFGSFLYGNHIGVDVTGTQPLGNVHPTPNLFFPQAFNGVTVGGQGNKVGGVLPGEANIIANNSGAGVMVMNSIPNTSGNSIRGNSIYGNGSLGIDLAVFVTGSRGINGNDAGDADIGANDRQNYPLLASVLSSASSTVATGSLNSTPNTMFTVDFYSSVAADPTGFGEGQTYLGSSTVTTDLSGNATFAATLPVATPAGRFVTATATNPNGSTSEFSGRVAVAPLSACHVPTADLVSCWAADGNAFDSQDGNHGTISGDVTFVPGVYGQAFLFGDSAAGDAVTLGSPANLQLQEFTIQTWIKRTSDTVISNDGGGGVVLGYGTGGYGLGMFNDGTVWLSELGHTAVFADFQITDTNFHHVAVSRSAGSVVFYLDGVPSAPQPYSVTFGFGTNVAIGALGDTNTNTILATLDEVAVHSRGLTCGEIFSVASQGSTANVAPYALDDSATTTSGIPVEIPVLANDCDSNNDPLTVSAVTQPANGTVFINPNGTVTYLAHPGFLGTDTFTYTADDGRGGADLATVTVTVEFGPNPATITGLKFHDLNGDGDQDAGEPGLGGINIYLDTLPNGVFDYGEPSQITDSNGQYSFSVTAGTYQVRETLPPGWFPTTPMPAPITITASGQVAVADSIGNFLGGVITGAKFNDLNGNGVRDVATSGPITVRGASDPWLAGMPDGSTASSGDVAPLHSPVLVPMTIVPGSSLTFDAHGCVHNGPSGCVGDHPDSGPATNAHFAGAQNGISNVVAPTNSLIGVFLGPNQPNLSPAPGTLDFSTAASRNFTTLSPVLQQTFFIGDGLTSSNQVQEFVVPTGATRLFLGTMDGFGWFNNSGAFSVVVNSATPAEPGIFQWTIELDIDADGTVDAATTTDLSGNYSFSGLPLGTHRVREVSQPGWTQTTVNPSDITVTASGQIFAGLDFGNRTTGAEATISGLKFNDEDADGVRDPGEGGLAYWPIFLDSNGSGVHELGKPYTHTNLFGGYSFTNLAPGTYRVREVQEPGWMQTTPNPADIVISTGTETIGDIDFGNDRDPTVTMITGAKFNDADGNGVRDLGEGQLAYWPIFIDSNGNGSRELGERLTWTNLAGNYAFAGVEPGTYRVRELQQPGWTQTTPNPADAVVTAAGETVSGGDFGNQRDATTLIAGRKFFDADSDGVADPGEPGLRYWPTYLDNNGDNSYQAGEPVTWTDWNGFYHFADVEPGTYRVREMQLSGWTQTTANPADFVVTADGQTFEDINFGNESSRSGPGYEPPTDLEISKDAPNAVAGERITYTLRVTNKGPADSYGVILGDQLAAGLVFESATPSRGVCFGGQTIVCALGPLAVNETATVTIVAHVLSWVQVEVENEACVYSTATDTDPADNCAITRTPIDRRADLELIKTSTPVIAVAGENLTYTLRVRNDGPSDSTNVTLEDELPPEVTLVSASSTHGSCTTEVTSVTTVVCDLGTITNGETATVTIVVNVTQYVLDGALVINRASVSSPYDPNPGNDFDIIFVPCGRSADLELTKTGPFTTIDADVYYVLEVTNHGPSDSSGVIVGDHLPPDINFLAAVPSKGSCNFNGATNVLICNLGPMVVDEVQTVTVFVGVPETIIIEDVRNEGIVWGPPGEGDPDPWNNHGGTGGIPPIAGIGVVKEAPPEIIAGETVTYTLHVTNEGPDPASNVIVGDTLPPGLGLVSVTTTQGSCYAFNPIICFRGALDVNESADVTIVVATPPSLPPGTILSNTAFGYPGLPPFPGFGHATTRVRRVADVEVEKTAPEHVVAGTEMTYTLKARNRGPSDATNITLKDELPPDVEFISADPSQGTCTDTETDGVTTVSCALGTIEPGEFATVEIVVFVPSDLEGGTIIRNGVCVLTQSYDPNLLNDCAYVATPVEEHPDLEMTKTVPPGPVIAGENIEFTLEVHNLGPSDARGVILGDALPAGVVFVSATATQGSCEYTGGAVICDIGYVAVGQREFVTIVGFIPPNTPDGTVITNTGCVIECGHDLYPDNDCDTVSFTVMARGVLIGNVFEDHLGDGFRNVGDQGLEGWTVFLDDNDNHVLDPGERYTLTDPSGNYRFTGLGKSTYRVREVVEDDWMQTTPDPAPVPVSGREETFDGGDFGNFELIDLSGTVYHDRDSSASRDLGEPGLGGWTVFIDRDSDGTLDAGEPNTLTNSAGDYTFPDLGPGTYTIREVVESGWTQTTPSPAPIIATSGDDVSDIDFGNNRAGTPGKITGGGSIDERVRNLGFVVMPKTQNGMTTFFGNLEFQDKSLGYNFKSESITFINIEPDRIHAQFTGTAKLNGVSGYRFFVELEDRAEPGAQVDKFRIQIAGPGGFTYDSNTACNCGGTLTKGGNIQIHKPGSSLTSGTGSSSDSSETDSPLVISAGQLLQGIVTIVVEDPGSAIDSAQRDRIDDALTTLNETFAPFGLTLTATTGSDGTADIRLLVDSTSPCGSAAAGVLGCTSDSNTITLLVGWNWYTGSDADAVGSGQYDYQTIVTHELGHALGLGHSGDTNSVMYSLLSTGVARRNLTANDLSGADEGDEDDGPEALVARGFAELTSHDSAHDRRNGGNSATDDHVQVLDTFAIAPDRTWRQSLDESSDSGDDVLIGGDGDDLEIGDAGHDRLIGGIAGGRLQAGNHEAAPVVQANDSEIHDATLDGVLEDWELLTVA
jgi:uncharacterized repeat protein (TIGR01451 family)